MSDVIGYGNSENVDDLIDEALLSVKGLGNCGRNVISDTIGGLAGDFQKTGDSIMGNVKQGISSAANKTMDFFKISSPFKQPLDQSNVQKQQPYWVR